MKESVWGVVIITFAVISILLIYFFQNVTNTDQQNYTLLREATEAAMFDAVDRDEYADHSVIKIDKEKFTESFIRRFMEDANLSKNYVVEIYKISEDPAVVSLKVKSTESTSATGELVEFDVSNEINGLLAEY